jgi:hypothetical protein
MHEVVADPAGQFPAGLVRAAEHQHMPDLQEAAEVASRAWSWEPHAAAE